MALNNAASTLAVAITTTSQTTVQVAAGDGTKFVVGNNVILYRAGAIELVKVTSIAGDVLTVTRATGGTTAATWVIGTVVTTGATGQGLSDMMLTPVANFKAGITMTGDVNMALDPTADLHPVRKSWVDANYYPASQPFQTALGYTPIEKAWESSNAVGIGWNGNLYLYLNSTYMGILWTSSNFNPGSKATKYAQVPWASGIWEVGKANVNNVGDVSTIDAGAPWCMEGARAPANGDFEWYVRAVWLRNS